MSWRSLAKKAKKIVKNPGRLATAAGTLGMSEVYTAADHATGDNLRNLINPDIPNASDGLRADEAARKAAIQSRIVKLREAYGEGDTPNAQAAQAGIERFISQLSGDSQSEAVSQAGDIYQADTRAVDEKTFNNGLQGGTADLEARRQALEGFVRNRQQIVNASKTAADKTRSGLQQERMGLEQEIAKGTSADPAWNATAAQRKSQLSGSWQDAWQQQLGTLVDGAGAGVAYGIRNGAQTPMQTVAARDQSNVNFFNANTGG